MGLPNHAAAIAGGTVPDIGLAITVGGIAVDVREDMFFLFSDFRFGNLLTFRQLEDVRVLLGIFKQNGQRRQFEFREVDVFFLAGVKESGTDAAVVGRLSPKGGGGN